MRRRRLDAVRTGGRLRGASTITQQVMKNFLLTGDRSAERKIKEIILATRLERALSKEEILELYLNEIFLGQNSYGVTAAAQTYFNKSLDRADAWPRRPTSPRCRKEPSVPPPGARQDARDRPAQLRARPDGRERLHRPRRGRAPRRPRTCCDGAGRRHRASARASCRRATISPTRSAASSRPELRRRGVLHRRPRRSAPPWTPTCRTTAAQALRDGLEQYDRGHRRLARAGRADRPERASTRPTRRAGAQALARRAVPRDIARLASGRGAGGRRRASARIGIEGVAGGADGDFLRFDDVQLGAGPRRRQPAARGARTGGLWASAT